MNEKSSAPISGPGRARRCRRRPALGRRRRRTRASRRVLIVAGIEALVAQRARVAPKAAATPDADLASAAFDQCPALSRRKSRTVPTSVASRRDDAERCRVAGLHRAQADHRALSSGATLRMTMVCAAVMMCAATTHRVDCQVRMRAVAAAAVDRRSRRSAAAIIGPGLMPTCPAGRPGQLCMRVDLAAPGSARTGRPRSSPWRRRSPPRRAGRSGTAVPSKFRASRPDSARRRAASSCGRRDRSRASPVVRDWCGERRSPPASAARPCRRAGRSRRPAPSRLPRDHARPRRCLPMPVCMLDAASSRAGARRRRRRAMLLEAELRMGVQIAADRRELVVPARGSQASAAVASIGSCEAYLNASWRQCAPGGASMRRRGSTAK